VLQVCGELGIEVMVLDRPNPLGGEKVEGNFVEPGFFSFVSQYEIPYIYGLTVGELAVMMNEEGLNRGQKGDEKHVKCKLSVVPMEGWKRDMVYADTKLPWVLPSPNIPTAEAAIHYPSAGICGEYYGYINIGIGYTLPFGVFGATWIDAQKLKQKLDSYKIEGTAFRTIYYKPIAGAQKGELVQGVQYFYTDYKKAKITLTQFYIMQAVNELYPDHQPTGVGLFDKVCGTDYIRLNFAKRHMVADIEEYWNKDVAAFKKLSKKYFLY
jgi:uncharacterized protein YbbC (DUF1343 family)